MKEYTPLEHVDRSFILQATTIIEKVYNDIQQVKKGTGGSTQDLIRIKDTLKGFPEKVGIEFCKLLTLGPSTT